MLFEIDIEEAQARFAELIITVQAGHGVLIRSGGRAIARLVPEAAFTAMADELGGDDGLTPEERHMREVMEIFEADMSGQF